jgi:MFS family permease
MALGAVARATVPPFLPNRDAETHELCCSKYGQHSEAIILFLEKPRGRQMSVWGAVIMSFFGSVFAALSMLWQWNMQGSALFIPFIVFFVVSLLAAYIIRMPGSRNVLSKRTGRVIMWSSIAEGVGLFIASNIIANLHRPELQLPVMTLIVGLHFVPIAFSASYRPFYALAAALIAAAVVGFILDDTTGSRIAGVVAAISLWIAAYLGVERDLRSKRASTPFKAAV